EERRLVGYVVTDPAEPVDVRKVREHVAGTLPEYMVPAVVLVLDVLPVTGNGKVDRGALPAPEVVGRVAGRGPSSEAECALCELFAEVLGVERVGVEESFFALGGDSIMSMQLAARGRRVGLLFTAQDVFERETAAGLAVVARPVGGEVRAPGGGTGEVPWTPVMRELGGFAVRPGLAQWSVVGAPPGLNQGALVTAVAALLGTHDMLRAAVLRLPAGPVLSVPAKDSVNAAGAVVRVDATDMADGSLDDLAARVAREAAGRLDPSAGVVLQVVWVDAGPGRVGRLAVVVHHLVVDGVSWRIVLPDLRAAYESAVAGRAPGLDPVGTPFRVWARALADQATSQERTAELGAWTTLLDGVPPPLGLPAPDPARDTAATLVRHTWTLPSRQARTLVDRTPAVFHCGVHDVLLAALAGAVARRRADGGTGVLVDVESHGREA
ncbi:condensation domain-containing protein, partial [Streptomyces zingiberis]